MHPTRCLLGMDLHSCHQQLLVCAGWVWSYSCLWTNEWMNGWIIFFKQRLQLVVLSYHLKIFFLFCHSLVSSLSFVPPCNQLICLRLVAALSQEGGVGRSMHWLDPFNGLCHQDKTGALVGSVCTAGTQGVVVVIECPWPCSCPAAEPAPGCSSLAVLFGFQ